MTREVRGGLFENVDRTTELLLGNNPVPAGFVERYFTRVQAYTAGQDREIGHLHLARPWKAN